MGRFSTRDIVVVGASVGGVRALLELAAALPADFAASLLAVLHVGSHKSDLPAMMSSRGPLRCIHPSNGAPLAQRTIYLAPPDHHMLVEGDSVQLTRGPKEHHTRPAIDPLFRSAALAHGPRVIGVVLTGRLDDGTAGLQTVKACGGAAVVQDPAEAVEPSMPSSALRHVKVDHCVPLARLGETLVRLTKEPMEEPARVSVARIAKEHAVSKGGIDSMKELSGIGKPSVFSCPDCSGVLFEIRADAPARFRCHTGHAYSLLTLADAHAMAAEEAQWKAIRALQERDALMRRLAEQCRDDGQMGLALEHDAAATTAAHRAEQLRSIVDTDPE